MANPILTGGQLAAITREMVRIKSQHYGRGAAEAKIYLCDNFLFCVLKGGMTPVERNLLEHGTRRWYDIPCEVILLEPGPEE